MLTDSDFQDIWVGLLRWPIERRCADYRLSYSETLTGLIVRYRTDTISCMRLSPTAQFANGSGLRHHSGNVVALYIILSGCGLP